jgi:hypothetical protein
MTDTTPEMAELYHRLLMELPPARRLAMACDMFTTARAFARAGILRDGPLPESEVRCRLFLHFYGSDFTEQEKTKILASLRSAPD